MIEREREREKVGEERRGESLGIFWRRRAKRRRSLRETASHSEGAEKKEREKWE